MFFYGEGNENQLGTFFSPQNTLIRQESCLLVIGYIYIHIYTYIYIYIHIHVYIYIFFFLRGHLCNIIVLNYMPKVRIQKRVFMKNYSRCSIVFLRTI